MDVPARIDHTVLGPETTPGDVTGLLDEAIEHGTNACIPPCHVERAAAYAPETTIATVVGFPHGQHTTGVKCTEAETAWEDVALMAEFLPVKASGGIGSWERAEAMFRAGAQRIGASSGATIAEEWRVATGGA